MNEPAFSDTMPLMPQAPDPYLAGVAAQLRAIREARQQGREPEPGELDRAFWGVYRKSAADAHEASD